MKPDEVKDGTLEDIILGLKSEPYRAAAASGNEVSRKSFRRQRSGNGSGNDRERDVMLTSDTVAV